MRILSLIVVGITMSFSCPLWADDLIEEIVSGKSTSRQAAAAKKEIQEQLIRQVAIKHIQFLVGAERFNQVSAAARQRILGGWERYILFLKAAPVKATPEGYEMEVAMKVSLKNLREILQSEGVVERKASYRYKLNLQLSEVDPKNIEFFKRELKNRIPDIRSIRERLISRNERIYEIDAFISPQNLAKAMVQIPWERFQLHIIETGELSLSVGFK